MIRQTLISTLLVPLVFFFYGCGGKNPPPAYLYKLGNGICRDAGSGLMWQAEESSIATTLGEARLYVKQLTLGGYTDWRLPTRQELYGLNYLFDLHLNGECDLNREGSYWSVDSDDEQGTVGAWEISANQCDPARAYARGRQGRVRAVRP